MTFDERVTALASLGFSERQTRFLVMVALHSGFCLRRHYTAFADLQYGAGVRDFLDRLVSRRLARRLDFRRDRGHVYHLYHSSIYAALEQNDNRNRRRTSAALIARKLMLLDYVLAHREADWYATEADKVELFTSHLGVPGGELPRRVYLPQRPNVAPTTRHFIHKLPISLTGHPPVPSLVFLVTDTEGRAFGQFLNDHLTLLNCLSEWQIVAVAPRHLPGLRACEAVFSDFARGRQTRGDLIADLETHFVTRDRIERQDWAEVSMEQINTFRETRERFASDRVEMLYARWKAGERFVLRTPSSAACLGVPACSRGSLVTYQLPIRYDRFGTYAGVV